MSILRYLNKHHGWYDGKRTPFTGAEEAAAAPIILEAIAPEAVGGTLATEGAAGLGGGGAFIPAAESGASFAIPEGAAYGVGAGAGAGAGYGGATAYELGGEYAADAAAKQAAAEEVAKEAAAKASIQNAGNTQLIGSGGGTFGLNAAPTGGAYGLTGSQVPTLTAGLGATAAPPTAASLIPGISNSTLGMGAAGVGLMSLMNADKKKYGVPAAEQYNGPLSKMRYDPSTYNYTAPVNRQYTPNYSGYAGAGYAEGGITDIDQDYAKGGIAGLLKGRGDGMSDSIHATIADKQPARLADGEFVVPADVVSHLGNGSTDAGAKHLYKMMDKVRHARTGTKKQGRQIAAGGYLPIK